MSWGAVLALCVAAYALKALGAVASSRTAGGAASDARLDLLVVPVIAGLVVVQTLGDGRGIEIDGRLPALLVAAALIAARASLLVVVIGAGATAALLHHLGL